MSKRLRILIADDQRLFADGLRVVIESRAPEFEVVGIAENGKEAIAKAERKRPDIVLMDVRMPEMDGVEATRRVHEKLPDVKILILTTFSDDEYVFNSLKHGAVGYLLKNRPAEELVESIRALGRGIVQIDAEVSAKILQAQDNRTKASSEFSARLHTLSPREQEILALMADAHRIVSIAKRLGIAEQTVRNHVSNIYSKLDIHDRLEIVNYVSEIREFFRHGTATSE
jgi:DNA-binding NarL/FixJ family response regulator